MLLIILLLVTVSAEWIEITQQYKKPISRHSSESDQVYFNDTIENWYKDRNVNSDEISVNRNAFHKVNFDINSNQDKVLKTYKNENAGKVERVPVTKIGNVERVRIPGSAVKSPTIKNGNSRFTATSSKHKGTTINTNQENITNNRKKNPVMERTKTTTVANSKEDSKGSNSLSPKNQFKNYKPIKLDEEKPQFVTERDSFETISTETENKPHKNLADSKNAVKKSERHEPKINKLEMKDPDSGKFVTKDETFTTQANEAENKINFKSKQNANNKMSNNAEEPQKPLIEDPKTNTLETVVKFMKIVADNISKNTRKNFNSKLRYLHQLRNSILANIENRIDSTWPDDTNRQRRSAEARGHVHFPSSESALMTISFLTFAVFLIKLVLQVIQTYKSKTMMVAPVVVTAAGRAIQILRPKQKNN